MAECGLPRQAGTSVTQTSTNIFGGDGLFRHHVNDLLPRVGGNWFVGASAGSFAVDLGAGSSVSATARVGARSARFLSV